MLDFFFCSLISKFLFVKVRKHQFLPPHSTIVKFHRSWEEQGRLYQQFELCNGTLQELAESQDDIPQVLVCLREKLSKQMFLSV